MQDIRLPDGQALRGALLPRTQGSSCWAYTERRASGFVFTSGACIVGMLEYQPFRIQWIGVMTCAARNWLLEESVVLTCKQQLLLLLLLGHLHPCSYNFSCLWAGARARFVAASVSAVSSLILSMFAWQARERHPRGSCSPLLFGPALSL